MPHLLLADIRDYLARFLFTGEEVFKKVSTLSGGERGRLALAKLSLTQANLLLLDEPTNHLDIPSQEILQEVLDEYQGTILLVSHDRYLIDALGTQIWEIEPSQAALQVYEGTYSQYRASQEALKAEADTRLKETASVQRPRPAAIPPEERRRRTRLKEVEAQIATLEEQLAVLSRKLENPPADPAKVQRLGQEYVKVQSELDLLIEEWEQLGRLADG